MHDISQRAPRASLASVAALALGASFLVAGLSGCRGWNSEEPPVHLNWNMDTQEKGKAYRKNADFADGRMMRPPVEGTVARGHLREDDHLHTATAENGELEWKFPPSITPDDALAAHGAARYQVYCTPCHGADAQGKGPVALKGGLLVPPPSLLDPRVKEMPNGQLYKAIARGVNNGNMPSYAVQIPVEDRWAIVAHIRKVQGLPYEPEPGPIAQRTPGPSPENGAALYKTKGCNACHSLDGSKIVGPSFRGLWGTTRNTDKGPVTVDEAYVKESVLTPMAKISEGFPPAMPPQQLNDEDIKSIVLFLQTLK